MLEQTGGDYLYAQQQNLNVRGREQGLPKMTKTRQQEWEEAVELDRMLEEERKQQSMQRLVQKSEERHNQYMEKISQPAVRNYSSNVSGLLGSSGVGQAMYPYANGSLPDLKQSKRQSKRSSS